MVNGSGIRWFGGFALEHREIRSNLRIVGLLVSSNLPFTRSRIEFTAAEVDQTEVEARSQESRIPGEHGFELRTRRIEITKLQQCLRELVADVMKTRPHGQRSA